MSAAVLPDGNGTSRGCAQYVENVRELLDAPREWFFDEATRRLYYAPEADAHPDTLLLAAATLRSLVEVRGTAAAAVEALRFDGLAFTESATTFMQRYEVPSGGDWSIHRGAAVLIDGAANVSVTRCAFERLGGNALMLSNDVVGSAVLNSTLVEVGDSAILAVGSTRLFDGTAASGRFPTRNRIEGNLVDTVGIFGKQTAAYFKALSRGNIVARNVFVNGPRSSVNFNDGGPGGEVLENLILNFVRESGDHGMFNSWDRQPYLYSDTNGATALSPQPHQIRNNLILNRNYATTKTTRSGYAIDCTLPRASNRRCCPDRAS